MQGTAIVCDFETQLLDGSPSLEFYREDFRVVSCIFVWRKDGEIKSLYTRGEKDTDAAIRFFMKQGNCYFVCHNLQFEYGVALHRFPGSEGMFMVDTMRLTQNYDGGGLELNEYNIKGFSIDEELAWLEGTLEYETGLSLQACASRVLPDELKGHKKPFYELIETRGGKKGDLHLLTDQELEEYTVADGMVTLALFEFLTAKFAEEGFDWTKDHFLYRSTTIETVKAKMRGILVDRSLMQAHVDLKAQQIEEIQRRFQEVLGPSIALVEARLLEAAVDGYKREDCKERVRANPPKFNPRSGKQKEMLFVEILGITPQFFTKTGKPSFSSKFAKQWGEGGEILKKQQSYMLEKKQGENALGLSEYDGSWHLSLKVAATATNRLAGGDHRG